MMRGQVVEMEMERLTEELGEAGKVRWGVCQQDLVLGVRAVLGLCSLEL